MVFILQSFTCVKGSVFFFFFFQWAGVVFAVHSYKNFWLLSRLLINGTCQRPKPAISPWEGVRMFWLFYSLRLSMLNVCVIHTEAQTSFREQTHYQCWNLQNLLPGLEQTEGYLSASIPSLHLPTLNLFPAYPKFSQGDLAKAGCVHCCSSNRAEQQTMNLFSTLNRQWENPFLCWAHPKAIGKDGLRTEDHLKAHWNYSLSSWVSPFFSSSLLWEDVFPRYLNMIRHGKWDAWGKEHKQ